MIAVDRQLARKVAVLLACYLRRLVSLLLIPQQHMLLHFRHVLRCLVLLVGELHQCLSVADRRVLDIASI